MPRTRCPIASVFLVVTCALSVEVHAANVAVAVKALDPNRIVVAGIRFAYHGVASPPTTSTGVTELRLVLPPGQRLEPGTALKLDLPQDIATTWFLIDDTIHLPGPGQPPAEVVLFRRADVHSLYADIRDAQAAQPELSPPEKERIVLEYAAQYGLSPKQFRDAIAAFRDTAKDPRDTAVAQFLVRDVKAIDPAGNPLAGIRFVYQDHESPPTSSAGVTELRVVLPPDQQLQAESMLELDLSAEIAKTWFLINDTIRLPGPGEPAAEAILFERAEMRRLVASLRDAQPIYEHHLTAEESRGIVLDLAAKYGLAPEDLDTAIAGFRHTAEDPMDEGTALFLAREYDRAEPLMRQALEIAEGTSGPDHPKVAIRLNNLASLLQAMNRLAEAEPLMRRALEIDEASFGPDHSNVARDLNNLALLLHATNRSAEAEPLMRRAVKIVEASMPPGHPWIDTFRGNLNALLEQTAESSLD